MTESLSTRVISICSRDHAEVWKLTSRLLPKFVQADEYVVYVPDDEIDMFRQITGSSIEVLSQATLGQAYSAELRRLLIENDNLTRYGWYLQQFFKIEALMRADTEAQIIWDADCVPVKPVTIFDDFGYPVYMRAGEFHQKYFEMIERLLGMPRLQNQSFVIPGFPIFKTWVNEFIKDVELRNDGRAWYEAIISCTDLSLRSGFSETESLGTWIANKYPTKWTASSVSWERFGQSRFGYAKDFTADQLIEIGNKAALDIVSFENWDHRGIHKYYGRLSRSFAKILKGTGMQT